MKIYAHEDALQQKKVMFVKRDAVVRLGETKELTGKGGKYTFRGHLHVEGEMYTFKEDGTGLSTQCIIPAGSAAATSNLDAKLYGGMVAERRQARLIATRAAAKQANMASRPKDVKDSELRRQTPDEKPV